MKTVTLIILFFFCTSILTADENDGVPIHGFFDISAGYNSKTDQTDFYTGALDLYIAKNLTDKINIFVDLVAESSASGYVLDLERLYIGYDVNQYLQTTFGKFHTPYGYWNTAFHHGLQLQTSILRPRFLAFEDKGGVLPSHSIGILASGDIDNFSYSLYITSGSSMVSNDANTSAPNPNSGIISTNDGKNQDPEKLYGINLAYYFLDDIKVGLHSYYQKVSIFNNRHAEVFMYGAYVATELDDLEFLAETYFFSNKNSSGSFQGERLNSSASYAQLAYDFNGLKPYARVEYTHYNQNDFYFEAQQINTGGSYDREALGLNYSLSQNANIKLALVSTNNHFSATHYYDVLTQFAVRF